MTSGRNTRYTVGDTVWVPTSRLPGNSPFALATRKVLGQRDGGRSIAVDDGTGGTVDIATRLVHAQPFGVLLLRMGDLLTEATLLDPLAKSILQYLRLLLPDDAVALLELRTQEELREFMQFQGAAFSHVVIVGHGTGSSLILPGTGRMPAQDFLSLLNLGGNVRTVISLACETGKAAFGKAMTSVSGIRDFAGPTSAVHGASASLFAQHLLSKHLLEGREFPTALRHANAAVSGTNFVHWRNGKKNPVKKPGRTQ